ncbi:hypothetical protein DTO021C3_3193 [Paecilomyces variotii]|nr:hypothetical protein DTO021C3_3193 [Paecilomyces variotii]
MADPIESAKSELRQQGAVETAERAAQDPQSNVRPENVEKVLIEESRKAGAPAFQFDPDAPPEEKAALAKSRLPPGFRDRKPKGIAVATDIDDGTPDKYDLPPPSKGAEMAVTPTTPANGEAKGVPAEMTDDLRYARDRTGWAPRFEIQKPEGEEEATLLDHQDFLESKLDDKFFGDWYHNAAVIVFACLMSWVVAVLGGGLAWVFIVMAACSTYYRTSIRRVRRNFRDDVYREMAKQRLETDTESLEWINSFLVKFWPIYAPVLCDTIINSVDQVLSTATPAFLDSLRLKTFILGTKPPRLEHVKTYPKTEVDTVIMDWKFSFTPNDVMDLTARQIKDKVNPKVVLEVRVGKGVVSKGLDVIVEDFAFSGLMRVKVKLQIPFPHIERVDVCFLERPDIDYVCKPLGGDTLGFDINFIPGLESFIKEQIHGNLAPMMYAPNVFPVEIAKMLAGNPVDQAIGVVAVTLHGARSLKNTDNFAGTPDPYAVVSINNRTPLGRTKTVQGNANPKWNETIYVIVTSLTDALTIQVYDFNEFRKDKELGVANFALDQLEEVPEHENVTLEVMASGRSRGAVMADVRFFPVLEGRTNDAGQLEPPPELNSGIARFTIEQAKDLDGSKSMVGALNPYAVLLLNGKEIHITNKLKRTNNPIFQNASKEFLVTDRKSARLGLVIKDDRGIVTDPIIGRYQIKFNDMMKLMAKGHEWFHLSGAKTGRAKMKLEWKPVALRGIAGGAGYMDPIGVMRLHLQSANDLRNLETMGKSDPYVRVLVNGLEKGRTVTFKNNLNPDWDEVVYVPIHNNREKITLEVMDEETLGKDRSLGLVDLSAGDYVRQDETGEYEIDDEKQLIKSGLTLGRSGIKGYLNYTVAFYPALHVVDPAEEAENEEEGAEEPNGSSTDGESKRTKSLHSKNPSEVSRPKSAVSTEAPKLNGDSQAALEPKSPAILEPKSPGLEPPSPRTDADSDTASILSTKSVPKVYLSAQDLPQYQSGFLVFKIIHGELSHSNVQLEVLMDDHLFADYTSAKVHSKSVNFEDFGDAFVRELDASKITLRLVEKTDKEGDDNHTIAKLTGETLPTLQRCLYTPTELTLRSDEGAVSKVTVSLRYIPVKMDLDPRESINNSGTLRVDVLDAADLPSADRNGYSDPYCKFKLAGKEVYKTKVMKKTLHPAWNEFFETPIKSRIGADLRCDVYDWDFGEKADYLGGTGVDLEQLEPFKNQEVSLPLDGKSGAIRLRMLFRPSYVTRSRMGSSTFSGTFATPGKIVGAPVKGVTAVGGGVIKGASFLKRGVMGIGGRKKEAAEQVDEDDSKSIRTTNGVEPPSPPSQPNTSQVDGAAAAAATAAAAAGAAGAAGVGATGATLVESTSSSTQRQHSRTRSIASQFGDRLGVGGKGDAGTATFTIVSANGYPANTNVRVHVKALGAKGAKEVHKTKAIKANSAGEVQFDASKETFSVSNTSAEAQYQLHVVDHVTFGSSPVLGEALFFVDDQGSVAGKEKSIRVGDGNIVVKSSFTPSESGGRPGTSYSNHGDATSDAPDSPDSKRAGRRSFLGKKSVSSVYGGQ